MDAKTVWAFVKDLHDALHAAMPAPVEPVPPIVPPPVVPPVSGVPNPLLLPAASVSQRPLPAPYDALKVPGLAAGQSYIDPVTGVRIYKLTSAIFPTAASSWGHDYSEGGDEVSLPHTGPTRTILVRNLQNNLWYLLDFTPGVGVSKPRPLTGNLAPWMDIAFAFSNNPATPHLAYVAHNERITRFDVRSMLEVPGDGWPIVSQNSSVQYGYPVWFHQAMNDSLFIWIHGASHGTTDQAQIVGYEPSTGTKKTRTFLAGSEPRVDRAGRYIGVSRSLPDNSLVVWDWQTDTITWETRGMAGTDSISQIPFAHNASLRRRWVGMQYNMNFPPPFWSYDPSSPTNSGKILTGGTGPGIPEHCCGNWVQPDVPLDDQWALVNMYGSLVVTGQFAAIPWLAPGHIVLLTANGQRRALACCYNTATDYGKLAFAKFSPDGGYVLFTSNMNGGPRTDVFLAELPTTPAAAPSAPSGLTFT